MISSNHTTELAIYKKERKYSLALVTFHRMYVFGEFVFTSLVLFSLQEFAKQWFLWKSDSPILEIVKYLYERWLNIIENRPSGLDHLLGHLIDRNKLDLYLTAMWLLAISSYVDMMSIWSNRKSEIHWMTSVWTWTLNGQKYPKYTPRGTNFGPFRSTTRRFEIQVCWTSEMHQMTSESSGARTLKSTNYTLSTHPEAQSLLTLRPAACEIQGC